MFIKSIYLLITFGAFLFLGLSAHVSETLILLLFGYTGILTHYIKKWSEKVEREEIFHFKKSVPSIILSIITTTVVIIQREEIKSLFVVTRFSGFIIGYFGNSWFFGFIEKKMYNLNPPIDENKNFIEDDSIPNDSGS